MTQAPARPATRPSVGARAASGARSFLDTPLASYHLILAVGAALALLGLVMVFSASSVDSLIYPNADGSRSPFGIFDTQATYLLMGLPAVWLGVRLRPATYRRLAYPALLSAVLLLVLVLLPGIGYSKFGASRWLDLGVIRLQPSELAKLAFLLWAADLLVRKQRMLGELRHLLVPLVPVAMLLGGLVMLEPDLGTTLCFVLILFSLLWTVGAPLRLFGTLFVAMLGGVAALIAVEPYRLQRVFTFLDPFADMDGPGLQSARGMYALATGGWWGVGLGNSRMKWGLLPNGHSDYIFAIIGEELGLLGCLVVLGLFAALAYAGLRIARRTADPFIRLVSSAVVVWLVGQAIINIGYVVGLLPVTGIPLPLVSSGGTSLILTMFIIGVLAGFARHEPDAVAHLRSHDEGRLARFLRLPVPRAAVDAPRRRRRQGRDRAGRGAVERLATPVRRPGGARSDRPTPGRPASGRPVRAERPVRPGPGRG